MRILITNDDGINADGINALIDVLSKEHELIVIAPDRERSATGHSLTLHKPLRAHEIDLGVPNTRAWHTTGTPTDCVKLAICSLLAESGEKEIDLIVTGINHGPNLGADVLYSGTVNAAIEGAIYSIPSIAISLCQTKKCSVCDFSIPAAFLLKFLRKYPEMNIPKNVILNINVPCGVEPEMNNVKITELGKRMYTDTYERREDPRGKIYYWLSGEPIEVGEIPGSDVNAVNQGFISITPVHFQMTDRPLMEAIKKHF